MKKLLLIATLGTVAFFASHGCATAKIDPNASALVVNVERLETVALGTFDLVLSTDDSNRAFFKEKAPAFHGFCEWLRAPQLTADGVTTLPRSLAMINNLHVVKVAYKANRGETNTLYNALVITQTAYDQARSWATNLPAIKVEVSKPQTSDDGWFYYSDGSKIRLSTNNVVFN